MAQKLTEPLNRPEEVDTFKKIAELEAKAEKQLAEEKLKALEKFEKRRLNAIEAKNLADTSLVQLNHLYKVIRDQAIEGYAKIEWSTENLSDACVDRLLKELKLDGYKVLVQKKFIVISW